MLHTPHELHDFGQETYLNIALAQKERQDLGLSVPDAFETHVLYQHGYKAVGFAHTRGKTPVLGINAVQFALSETKNVETFFAIAQNLLRSKDEYMILKTLRNPIKTLSLFEWSFPYVEELNNYVEYQSLQGVTYEEKKNFLIETARPALEELVNIKSFAVPTVDMLRGLLDHVDFFASPIYQSYRAHEENLEDLEFRLIDKTGNLKSERYAKGQMDILRSYAELTAIAELRSLYLEYMDVEKVLPEFTYTFIHGPFIKEAVARMTRSAIGSSEMNKATYQALQKEIGFHVISPLTYHALADGEADHGLVHKMIHRELRAWKDFMFSISGTAMNAIETAYLSDPRRLQYATYASSFEEFCDICASPLQ
ncbi:hypothetical protein H6504_01600 [Candidatus Woesearchaeota archaeon]|nr:hypothetical protein [Candidatus Woesearchaeota archaeon]